MLSKLRFVVVGQILRDPMARRGVPGFAVIDTVTGHQQRALVSLKEAKTLAARLNRKELSSVRSKD
jgi:hypothetical protein